MRIFGLELPRLRYENFISEIINNERQTIVFTPNPEILLNQKKDSSFKDILNKATYLTSDGIGLYIAFQILDNNHGKIINILLLPYYLFNIFFRKKTLYAKYGDRICGSDLTRDLLDYAEKNSLGVVILDLYNPTDLKKVESQKIMAIKLREKYKNIKFYIRIYKEEEKNEVIKEVNQDSYQIILATMGAKKQEKAIIDVLPECKDLKIGLGIGSSIDYLIGFQKRAPIFWRKLGLEWLYRLMTGPRKIDRLKRIYNAIFVFIYEVIKSK